MLLNNNKLIIIFENKYSTHLQNFSKYIFTYNYLNNLLKIFILYLLDIYFLCLY